MNLPIQARAVEIKKNRANKETQPVDASDVSDFECGHESRELSIDETVFDRVHTQVYIYTVLTRLTKI